MEGVPGELRDDHALEGIDVADAEDMVPDLGHFRVRGGGADHRDAGVLADGRRGEAAAAGHLAEDRDDSVLRDQLVHRGGRLLGPALVVLHENVDLLPPDASRGVQIVHEELDPVLGRDAEGGGASGERAVFPDFDLRFALRAAREEEKHREGEDGRAEDPADPDHGASLRGVSV